MQGRSTGLPGRRRRTPGPGSAAQHWRCWCRARTTAWIAKGRRAPTGPKVPAPYFQRPHQSIVCRCAEAEGRTSRRARSSIRAWSRSHHGPNAVPLDVPRHLSFFLVLLFQIAFRKAEQQCRACHAPRVMNAAGQKHLDLSGAHQGRIPFHESHPALRVLYPEICPHLDFPLLNRVDHPPPTVVVGWPVEPCVFSVRQKHEPMRRIPVQLCICGSIPVQRCQPLLRGRRLEELLQMMATTSDYFGGKRSPRRRDPFNERLQRIPGHNFFLQVGADADGFKLVRNVGVCLTWRNTHHLHLIRASDATSRSSCATVEACRNPISTCSSPLMCCSRKAALRALPNGCGLAHRR